MINVAVFVALIVSNGAFLRDGGSGGSLPTPSILMLIGVGGGPMFFVALYVLGFERYVFGPKEERRLEELTRATHARSTAEGTDGRAP